MLTIFGVNDYSRLNRKVFHLLQTNKPILYFGPANNVTHRILSNYEGVYFNPSIKQIRKILIENHNYSRSIDNFLYENMSNKLHEDICNSDPEIVAGQSAVNDLVKKVIKPQKVIYLNKGVFNLLI